MGKLAQIAKSFYNSFNASFFGKATSAFLAKARAFLTFEPLGTHIFLGLLSNSFIAEHFAVAKGMSRFNKSNKDSSPLIRRNIHRIEKGLTAKNRKQSFAESYVLETVVEFEKRINHLEPNEKHWTAGVLKKYFEVTQSSNKNYIKAKHLFLDISPSQAIDSNFQPFFPKETKVNIDSLRNLALSRRSTRWFLNEPIDMNLIEQALDIAIAAPSSCNRLPYRYHFYSEDPMRTKVASLPLGADGFRHQIPVIGVIIGDFSSYFSPRDRHAVYTDSAMSAMNFSLALHSLGLASTLLNWPELWIQDVRAARVLGLKSHEKVVMMIALGYPDTSATVPSSVKKNIESFAKFN